MSSNNNTLNPDADINDKDDDVEELLASKGIDLDKEEQDQKENEKSKTHNIVIPKIEQKKEIKYEDIEDDLKNDFIMLDIKEIDLSSVELTYDPAKSNDLVVGLMTMYPDVHPNLITYTVSKTQGNEVAAYDFLDNLMIKPNILGKKINSFSTLALQVLGTYQKIFNKNINNTPQNIGRAVLKLCKHDKSLILFFIQFQVNRTIKDRVVLTSKPSNMNGIQESIYNLKMELEYCTAACDFKEQTGIKTYEEALSLLRACNLDLTLALNKYYQEHFD